MLNFYKKAISEKELYKYKSLDIKSLFTNEKELDLEAPKSKEETNINKKNNETVYITETSNSKIIDINITDSENVNVLYHGQQKENRTTQYINLNVKNSKKINIIFLNKNINSINVKKVNSVIQKSNNIFYYYFSYNINSYCLYEQENNIDKNSSYEENSIIHLKEKSILSRINKTPILDENISFIENNDTFQDRETTFSWNSIVYISKNANNIFTKQISKTVNDGKCKTYGRPQLFIERSNVDCAHGFTKGGYNKEQINYLNSKGIENKKAKKILNQSKITKLIYKINEKSIFNILTEFYIKEGEMYA